MEFRLAASSESSAMSSEAPQKFTFKALVNLNAKLWWSLRKPAEIHTQIHTPKLLELRVDLANLLKGLVGHGGL